MKETSFLQFGELPKEIRLAIWEAAIPGPRIVDLRDQPLKITAGELKDQIREQKSKRELEFTGTTNENTEKRILKQESWLERAEDVDSRTPAQYKEQREKMFGFHPMGGFKSKCPAPEILFACRESHEVATRYYERAFHTVAAFAETWLDFHRDVVYIRWDKCRSLKGNRSGIRSASFDDWVYHIPYMFDEEFQIRIENLAILMDRVGLAKCDMESIEEFLAGILHAFGGVKTLTLVARHVGSYSGSKHNSSQLSFHKPSDTDYLEVHHGYAYSDEKGRQEMEIIHDIPELDIDWLKVDMEELQRLSEEVTNERPTPWMVPKIEYKIVVPDSYQPFLGWTEEKRIETGEWETEQEERNAEWKRTRDLPSRLAQLHFDQGGEHPNDEFDSSDELDSDELDSDEDERYQYEDSDEEEL